MDNEQIQKDADALKGRKVKISIRDEAPLTGTLERVDANTITLKRYIVLMDEASKGIRIPFDSITCLEEADDTDGA